MNLPVREGKAVSTFKLQIASDLHLEHLKRKWPGERLIAPNPQADVLVLAGDIANGIEAFKLFESVSIPVIYVAGNHEFYEQSEPDMRVKMRERGAETGIHFLDNASVVVNGVRFLGTTLWTDYKLSPNYPQSQAMEAAQRQLNDHTLIRCGGSRFSTQHALDRHLQARSWLESELHKPFDGKTVVVSHHGPHPLSVHPRFRSDSLSAAFVSNLSHLMPYADLWIQGHVHDSFNYQVGRCRVVANPAGYVLNRAEAVNSREFQFENRSFDKNLLVSLA